MKKKRLENGEVSKLIVLGFLLTIGLLATYYFHFILRIDIASQSRAVHSLMQPWTGGTQLLGTTEK